MPSRSPGSWGVEDESMRAFAVRSVAMVVLLGAALAGDAGDVVSIEPGDGAKGVLLDTSVRVVLKDAIDPVVFRRGGAKISLFTDNAKGREVEVHARTDFDPEKNRLSFSPRGDFKPNTVYRVKVSVNYKEPSYHVVEREWSFTTGTETGWVAQNEAREKEEQRSARAKAYADAKRAVETGDPASALGPLRSVKEGEPNFAESRYCLAEALLRISAKKVGTTREALPSWEALEVLVAGVVADPALYAGTYAGKEEFRVAALRDLVSALGKTPSMEDPETLHRIAVYFDRPGANLSRERWSLVDRALSEWCEKADSPEALFEQILFRNRTRRAGPDTPLESSITFERVLEDKRSGDELKSKAAYEMGLILYEGRAGGRGSRGADALEAAEGWLRDALEFRQRYPEAELGLGIVLRARGKLPLSQKSFERALEYQPDLKLANLYLHMNFLDLGDEDSARKALDRELALWPDKGAFYMAYAGILQRAGKEDRAVDLWIEAAKASGDAQLWQRAALWCYEHRNYEKAREPMEQAVKCGLATAANWTLLAEIRKRVGDAAAARQALEQALKLDPKSVTAWRSLRLAGQEWGEKAPSDEILATIADLAKRFGECQASWCEIGFLHGLDGRIEDAGHAYVKAFRSEKDDEMAYASLWELAQILGPKFPALEEAILGDDPGHRRLMEMAKDIEESERMKQLAACRAARRRGASGDGGEGDGSHGANWADVGAYEAMRDLETETAGSLGAVGLGWTDCGDE